MALQACFEYNDFTPGDTFLTQPWIIKNVDSNGIKTPVDLTSATAKLVLVDCDDGSIVESVADTDSELSLGTTNGAIQPVFAPAKTKLWTFTKGEFEVEVTNWDGLGYTWTFIKGIIRPRPNHAE